MNDTVPLGSLWFGLAGAPLAWSVQELAGYALAARDCGAGRSAAIALGLATTVIGVGAGLTAYRAWRASGPGEARTDFMAFGGLLSSGLFLLLLAANLALAAAVPAC